MVVLRLLLHPKVLTLMLLAALVLSNALRQPANANTAKSTPATAPAPPPDSIPPARPATPRPLNTLDPQPDPLLPNPAVKRNLSPLEVREFRQALDKLNTSAEGQWQEGDRIGAYATWFRELRLRRTLGPTEEIPALARVGDRAWGDGFSPEVQVITRRLEAIEAQAKTQTANPNPREPLADAYIRVRALPQAIALHEAILADPLTQATPSKREATLVSLSQLYLGNFQYPQAIATTRSLLDLTRAKPPSDRLPREELRHLEQIAYLQETARDFPEAIATQTQLLDLYQQNPLEIPRIPATHLAIALNHQKAGQLSAATTTYQQAYTTALPLQQLAIAHDALDRLGSLYEAQGQPADAQTIYTTLLEVDQLSYNLYGLLETHRRIGLLYQAQGQSDLARRSFDQALHLARQLQYRVAEIEALLAPPSEAILEGDRPAEQPQGES